MIYLAILATALFVLSSWGMVRDAYRAVRALDRPTVLSIFAFSATSVTMTILWWLVWSGK